MKKKTQGFVIVTESYKQERNMQKTSTAKRRSLYCIAALLTVILVLVFNTANIANKYFTSIEVQAGTSLWDIAEEYMTEEYDSPQEYIQEVKNINHMNQDLIYEGSYLCVPYYSSEKK